MSFDWQPPPPPNRHGTSVTLGTIHQIFRGDYLNVTAALILGSIIMCAAGTLGWVFLPKIAAKLKAQVFDSELTAAVFAVAIAGVLSYPAWILFVLVKELWGIQIAVGDRGFSWKTAFGKEDEFLWDDMISVELHQTRDAQAISGDLLLSRGATRSLHWLEKILSHQTIEKYERSYNLTFKPDRTIELHRYTVIGHNILGDLAMIEGERRGITPKRTE